MPPFALPLTVLVAAPRPSASPLDPTRMRVEAFYDALEAQGQSARVEWLWPATYEALVERLEHVDRPPVAALYLDALVASAPLGLALIFESAEPAGRPIPLADLGALLNGAGVPLLILAAIPAGPQVSVVLSAALAGAGMPHVIVTNPTWSASQTQRVMTDLWTGLLAGHAVSQAVDDARQGLEPVSGDLLLYQSGDGAALTQPALQGSGAGKVIRFPSPDLAPAWRRLAVAPEAGGLPPEPERGLLGRGREMAQLEGALRGAHGNGIVVLSGPEGIGKSTLAAHAARWLVRSGRFSQVVYTSFVGGGYPEVAVHDLGVRLLGEHYDPASGDLLQSVERALDDTPTLIIWDHLESILPGGPFAFPAQTSGVAGVQGGGPLAELLALGVRFAGIGSTRLVVIADRADLPYPDYAALDRLSLAMDLSGLDPVDASGLLALPGADSQREEALSGSVASEMHALIRALNGHPLALAVLAPVLVTRSLGDLLDELDRLVPGVRQGQGPMRAEVLELALQPLFLSLPESLRDKLPMLGLFVAGMMEPMVSTGTALEPSEWAHLRRLLGQARLLHEERLPGFSVPLVRLHPAFTRRLSRRLSSEQRRALADKYCASYMGLANWISQGEKRSPEPMRALVRRELPNFRHTFRLLLELGRLNTANDYVRYLLHFLDLLGYSGEAGALRDQMQQLFAQALAGEAPLARPQVLLLINQGDYLLNDGRLNDAGSLFQQLVERMEKENGLAYSGDDARLDLGMALHRLGRCLRGMGNAEATVSAFTRARDLLGGIIGGRAVQEELLGASIDLGEVLLRSMQVEPAAEAYSGALTLATELQDQRALANIEVAHGTIAAARNDTAGAREALQRALDHWTSLGDQPGMAATWNQLGALDHAQNDLAAAEHSYREALRLAREAAHLALQAQVLASLASVLQGANRLDEAEQVYMETIAFYQEHQQRPLLARAEAGLAELFLRRGKVQEARVHGEAARALAEDLGPEMRPWEIYTLLQRISVAEGDSTREAQWRARARESFASSPLARQTLQQWKSVIMGLARACRGEALDSATVELMEKMEENDAWRNLVATLWRVLAGERGPDLYEPLDLVDSLVVRRLLDLLDAPDLDVAWEQMEKPPAANGGPLPGISLPLVFDALQRAMEGNSQARQMVGQILLVLSAPEAPQLWRDLGASLVQLLQGNRNVQELTQGISSPDLAAAIKEFVENLDAGSN